MIRVLFILLAVVATILAIVLQQPLLYVIAGVLLLAALASAILYMKQRSKTKRDPYLPTSEPNDDLGSLGILEIRPKGAQGVQPGDVAQASPAQPSLQSPTAAPLSAMEFGAPSKSQGRPHAAAVRVRKKTHRSNLMVETVAEPHDREVLLPCLHALGAALSAYTVCVLRQDVTGLRYDVEAIISQSSFARSHGRFSTQVPLLSKQAPQKHVTVERVGEAGLSSKNLGYYREPIAVRQIALARVPVGDQDKTYLLVADTREDADFGTPQHLRLLEQFTHLIGVLLETPTKKPEATEEEATATEDAVDGETLRPRREIIAEEMTHARSEQSPLALALVYLNLTGQDPAAIARAEAGLETHLRATTPDGRIERFGELTFGVFQQTSARHLADWAVQVQSTTSDSLLPGELSVGIALLQDRHLTPNELREDATAALREAYETGTCTILE